MKKTALLLCLLFSSVLAQAQWSWLNPLPQGNQLNSVCFANASTGYAVGDNGAIVKTSDAGTTWLVQSSGTKFNLKSVSFPNVYTGYAVGDYGTMVKTDNGGVTWNTLTGGTVYDMTSVYFTDVNTGYAVGDYGTILKTTNAGATWVPLSAGTNSSLTSVFFTGSSTGFITGSNGTILKTNNGGGFPVSIEEPPSTGTNLKLFPNPANSAVTIETTGKPEKAEVLVLNLSGRVVLTGRITGPTTQLDISALPAGVYFVRVMCEKTVQVAKVIKL